MMLKQICLAHGYTSPPCAMLILSWIKTWHMAMLRFERMFTMALLVLWSFLSCYLKYCNCSLLLWFWIAIWCSSNSSYTRSILSIALTNNLWFLLVVLITDYNAFIFFYFCLMFLNVIGVLRGGVGADDKSTKLIILGPLGPSCWRLLTTPSRFMKSTFAFCGLCCFGLIMLLTWTRSLSNSSMNECGSGSIKFYLSC